MYFIFLSFRLCFVILPCLFNPAFHAAILNKPLIDRQRDRRTDRQTSCHCKVRGMNARRAVNVYEKIAIFSTNISLYLRNDTIGDRAFCSAGQRRVEQLVVIDAECTFVAGISAAVEIRTFPSLLRLPLVLIHCRPNY